MVTAEPVLPRLVLSDSQVGILQSIVRKTRCPQAIALRARAVLAEDRLLRLTPHEVNQLERALDSEPEVIPQLKALIRRISESTEAVAS